MLKEQFIDNNILILKIDGTSNDFFVLVNENTIPDYNIPKYLNSLKCKQLKIKEVKLLSGNIIQIHNSVSAWENNLKFDTNKRAEQIDSQYNPKALPDGSYYTDDKKTTFYVKKGIIKSVTINFSIELKNGENMEIENGCSYIHDNLNKKITINGKPIESKRLIDADNIVYEIKESKIAALFVMEEYELKNGTKVKIEQKDFSKIGQGDKIVDAVPIFPLPDGRYKIKGKWEKITIKSNIIQ